MENSQPCSFRIPLEFSNENRIANSLLQGLNQFREEGSFCDITLKVGEKTIRVHKNVICACSPYFSAMFSGPFKESNQEEIVIKDIDADCLGYLIDYMYTGSLEFESKNVQQVLLTASFLQIETAEDLCCTYLIEKLNLDNCIENLMFAGKNSIETLLNVSINIVVDNFHNIFYKNDYLEIEFDEFKLLTQRLKENGHPEDIIYTFILRWIDYSHESRINFIQKLLDNLDPSLVSPDVLNNPTYPISNSWVTQAKAAVESTSSSNDPNEQILVTRRLGTFRPIKIKIFTQAKHCEIYSLPETIFDGSYACNGYYIYHQGGWKDKKQLLTESYAYHPIKKEWIPFVPLQEARAYHHSCVLNGKIYSVGGSDGLKALSSVEFIDLYTGQRGFTDPLPRAKERAGLALQESSIYVVGGSNRGICYDCIHRLDVREGKWQELAPSPYRAGANSCGLVGENIYTAHPDTLQRYDIRANNWEMISAQYKRYPQEVFSLDDTLFGLFSDHIAKFVHEGGKWDYIRSLKFKLEHLQVSTNLRFPKDEIEEECIHEHDSDNFEDTPSEGDSDEEREFIVLRLPRPEF